MMNVLVEEASKNLRSASTNPNGWNNQVDGNEIKAHRRKSQCRFYRSIEMDWNHPHMEPAVVTKFA